MQRANTFVVAKMKSIVLCLTVALLAFNTKAIEDDNSDVKKNEEYAIIDPHVGPIVASSAAGKK